MSKRALINGILGVLAPKVSVGQKLLELTRVTLD